jgi:hypothetical protein
MVFFAGFATAIYGLAPVDQIGEQNGLENEKVFFSSFTKSDQFAKDCGRVLQKWTCVAEEAANSLGQKVGQVAAQKISSRSVADTDAGVSQNGGSVQQ